MTKILGSDEQTRKKKASNGYAVKFSGLSAASNLSRAFDRWDLDAAYDILTPEESPNASPGTSASKCFSKRYLHTIRL